jgi:hypothetical protein
VNQCRDPSVYLANGCRTRRNRLSRWRIPMIRKTVASPAVLVAEAAPGRNASAVLGFGKLTTSVRLG